MSDEPTLDAYKQAAPLCEDHQPTGGARSGCLVCACIELSRALSEIDYLTGEPNEYHVSGYDVFADPEQVIENVKAQMQDARRWQKARALLLSMTLARPVGNGVASYCPIDDANTREFWDRVIDSIVWCLPDHKDVRGVPQRLAYIVMLARASNNVYVKDIKKAGPKYSILIKCPEALIPAFEHLALIRNIEFERVGENAFTVTA